MKNFILFLKNYIGAKLSNKFGKAWVSYIQNRGLTRLKKRLSHFPFFSASGPQLLLRSQFLENYHQYNILGITLDKAMIQAEKELRSCLQSCEISFGFSTGTTGNPTPFLTNNNERVIWFARMLARVYLGFPRFPLRFGLFLKFDNKLYSEMINNRHMQLKFFNADIPVSTHLASLKTFSPQGIVAPPQILEKIDYNLDSIKQIWSAAEILDDHDRNIIEHKLGKSIGNIYQASEGFLGITCQRGNLHLNEDIMVIEKYRLYDNPNIFLPVITDFVRESQSIIRLLLEDVLKEANSPCDCGSPFITIERIEGRLNDIILAPSLNKNMVKMVYPSQLTKIIFKELSTIDNFNLIQSELNKLDLITSHTLSIEKQNRLHAKIKDHYIINQLVPPQICFLTSQNDSVEYKKRRRIQSLIKRHLVVKDEQPHHEDFLRDDISPSPLAFFSESSPILSKIFDAEPLPHLQLSIDSPFVSN